jgi:hypothetical protein
MTFAVVFFGQVFYPVEKIRRANAARSRQILRYLTGCGR